MADKKRRSLKRAGFWFVLVLLFLAISFVLTEVVLRFTYSEEEVNGNYWGRGAFSGSPTTGFKHTPGYEGYAVRPDTFRIPAAINSLGLRQSNFESQRQLTKRVLVLGDSFPFGLGVRENQGFVSLIQESLNSSDIGVINGAQSGFSAEQAVRFGKELFDDVDPSIVVLCVFPSNDVEADFHRRYLNVDVRFGYRLPKDRSLKWAPVDFLRARSYLWMVIESKRQRQYQIEEAQTFKRRAVSETAVVTKPTLDAIHAFASQCQEKSIAFGVVLIPHPAGESLFDKVLTGAMKQSQIRFLDLGTKGFKKEHYLIGDGHWNTKGHQKATRYVIDFIRSLALRK